jgi:hypothetical protein
MGSELPVEAPKAENLQEAFISWIARNHEKVPGVTARYIHSHTIEPIPFRQYELLLRKEDGGFSLTFESVYP